MHQYRYRVSVPILRLSTLLVLVKNVPIQQHRYHLQIQEQILEPIVVHRSRSLPTLALDCCSRSGRIVFDLMKEIKIIFEYMYEKKTFNKLERMFKIQRSERLLDKRTRKYVT